MSGEEKGSRFSKLALRLRGRASSPDLDRYRSKLAGLLWSWPFDKLMTCNEVFEACGGREKGMWTSFCEDAVRVGDYGVGGAGAGRPEKI
jgi:hypothetical protein